MKRFFTEEPVYLGKRKNLPDFLPNMCQEDHIIVFVIPDNKIIGINHPHDWVDKFIHKPLRERTKRNKKGRFI